MMEMRKEDLIKLLTETQQQLKTAMAVLGNDANSKEERAKIPEPNRENLQDWKQACARSAHQLKIDYHWAYWCRRMCVGRAFICSWRS